MNDWEQYKLEARQQRRKELCELLPVVLSGIFVFLLSLFVTLLKYKVLFSLFW